jgi:hypothetical protein
MPITSAKPRRLFVALLLNRPRWRRCPDLCRNEWTNKDKKIPDVSKNNL